MTCPTVIIVTPVYNDWDCLARLLADFEALPGFLDDYRVRFLVVNDGSAVNAPSDLGDCLHDRAELELLQLPVNRGHQWAIAIGLSFVEDHHPCDYVLVMDSDGEDNPAAVPGLLQAAASSGRVTVAQRKKRSEGLGFRLFYGVYKSVFHFLTAHTVDFGNFVVLPKAELAKLVVRQQLWCNFPATIIRTVREIQRVPTDRSARYAGTSKMNFARLILHGMSAIAVFTDLVMVRLLVLGTLMVVLSAVGLTAVASIRLFTDLAIPGWASNVFGTFCILLGIALWSTLTLMLTYLDSQNRLPFLPLHHYKQFLGKPDER